MISKIQFWINLEIKKILEWLHFFVVLYTISDEWVIIQKKECSTLNLSTCLCFFTIVNKSAISRKIIINKDQIRKSILYIFLKEEASTWKLNISWELYYNKNITAMH